MKPVRRQVRIQDEKKGPDDVTSTQQTGPLVTFLSTLKQSGFHKLSSRQDHGNRQVPDAPPRPEEAVQLKIVDDKSDTPKTNYEKHSEHGQVSAGPQQEIDNHSSKKNSFLSQMNISGKSQRSLLDFIAMLNRKGP